MEKTELHRIQDWNCWISTDNIPKPDCKEWGRISYGDLPERLPAKHWDIFLSIFTQQHQSQDRQGSVKFVWKIKNLVKQRGSAKDAKFFDTYQYSLKNILWLKLLIFCNFCKNANCVQWEFIQKLDLNVTDLFLYFFQFVLILGIIPFMLFDMPKYESA